MAFKTWCEHQFRLGIICPPGSDRVKVAAKTWCGHVPTSTCPQARLHTHTHKQGIKIITKALHRMSKDCRFKTTLDRCLFSGHTRLCKYQVRVLCWIWYTSQLLSLTCNDNAILLLILGLAIREDAK